MAEFTVIEQQTLMGDLSDQQRLLFTSQYDSIKKDRNVVLILSVIFGWLGVDRFMIGSFGMGLFKLFTFGGLGLLWLLDLFIIRGKVDDLNRKNATEIHQGIKMMKQAG
jgi:TM2 domain-containing membrane protein YozV